MPGADVLRRASLFLLALVFAAQAYAAPARKPELEPDPERATEPEREPEPGPVRRAVAIGASVVPGVVVHGSGHWVAGRPRAARRLLLLEGIGLGAFLGGGLTLVLTGANRYVVGPRLRSLSAVSACLRRRPLRTSTA